MDLQSFRTGRIAFNKMFAIEGNTGKDNYSAKFIQKPDFEKQSEHEKIKTAFSSCKGEEMISELERSGDSKKHKSALFKLTQCMGKKLNREE